MPSISILKQPERGQRGSMRTQSRRESSRTSRLSSTSTRPLSALLLLHAALLLNSVVEATVTVLSDPPSKSRTVASYPSRPANFGNNFEFGLEYVARVQLPPRLPSGMEDSWLCGDENIQDEFQEEGQEEGDEDFVEKALKPESWSAWSSSSSGGWPDPLLMQQRQEFETSKERLLGAAKEANEARGWWHATRQEDDEQDEKEDDGDDVIVPPDGMPVAILAQRGKCSYETKARVATSLLPKGTVRYVIVYDDIDEDRLIQMASENGEGTVDGVDVGLLFISKKSGEDLIQRIARQSPSTRADGGPRVLLDSFTNWFPGGGGFNPLSWLGTILLSLACLMSCSCLFVSESVRQAGNGQVVAVRRRQNVVLLTEEEVRTLPEVVYTGPGSCDVDGNKTDTGENGGEGEGKAENDVDTDNPASTEDDRVTEEKKGARDAETELESPLLSTDQDEAAATAATLTEQPSTLNERFDNTACSICLEEYDVGCRLRVLPCHHAFHSDCIMPWLTQRSPTCPLCKAEFEGAGGDDDDENDSDSVGGSEARHDGNTRAVASMLGLDIEAATPPRMVSRRIDEDEESEGSGPSPVDFGFLRFMFGRRRLQEETNLTAQQMEEQQEIEVQQQQQQPQQQPQQEQEEEEGSAQPRARPGQENVGAATAAISREAATEDADAVEAAEVNAQLREPLLCEQVEV